MSYLQDQIQGCHLSEMIRPIDRERINLDRFLFSFKEYRIKGNKKPTELGGDSGLSTTLSKAR
jgi:hypothetical protein